MILDKYRNRTPTQMAINFKNITKVYRALVQNEFIAPSQLEIIQQQTKDQLRQMISSQYEKDVLSTTKQAVV